MAHLIIQHLDGSKERRELSRNHQFSIGRQEFNDLCIPEDDVHSFHCRIGWNRNGYELTSATSAGVDVNSTTVAQVNLKSGDVIRIGSVDLTFEEGAVSAKAPAEHTRTTVPPTERSGRSSRKEKLPPEPPPIEELSSFEGDVFSESQEMPEIDALPRLGGDHGKSSSKSDRHKKDDKSKAKTKPVRPGEQDIFKSPLVLGLTGGGLLLLLVTGIFWFLISREQAKQLYDRAVAELNGGQPQQAAVTFEKFIALNPRHGFRRQAERGLGEANIMKEISGAAPSWQRGLEGLNEYIQAHRGETDFVEVHPTLFRIAEQISLGAAKSAEVTRDPKLLDISKEAQVFIERYADPAAPPVGTIGRISEQRVKAERAIEKQRTFDQSMSAVDSAIAQSQPMLALAERERLIRAFPEFADSRRVKDTLLKAIDLEKSVVKIDDTEVAGERTEPDAPESILPYLHVRSRTDESAGGRLAYVVAKDSLYAVDSVTGELVWRRVIGRGTPFFPLSIAGAQSSLLVFDTRSRSLVCCQAANGKFIWSQALNADVIGAPLVHEGQVYQAVDGRSLVRLDVDSGRISARVNFSQNLAGTPALSRDGDYLLAPGERAMIYALTVRATASVPALSVVATTFTDHSAGSVVAPALSMGRLLLVCENDRADRAKLRLWDASVPDKSLVELDSATTNGQVRDVPVLRGNQLIVPSAGEQFSAFAVTDDAGRAGIRPIGQYRADQARMSDLLKAPLFVSLGSDGQFWSAGTAFRRFEIESDSIRMDSNSAASGIASQPLQMEGDYFFVGRKSRFADAVTFTAIERDKLVSPWRCIVGDAPLELLPAKDDGLFWVGESGTLYTLRKNRLQQNGGDVKAGVDLDLPANITKPIRVTALPDQRMVVAAIGDTKSLIVINNAGQPTGKLVLPDELEADPVMLDDGLVLPVPGRLRYLPFSGGNKKTVQDWIAPAGEDQKHRWSSLTRIDQRELIACEASGKISRIQLRQGDTPHLAEVAKFQMDQPIDVRPVLRNEFLYIVDAGGNFRQLNIHSFDVDGQRTLPAPVRQLWSVGKSTVAWAGDGTLYCMEDGKSLAEKWTFGLNGLEPVGPVVVDGGNVWLGCRDGTVVSIDANSGQETKRIKLPQSLSIGLRKVKKLLIAVAADGTIYRVEE